MIWNSELRLQKGDLIPLFIQKIEQQKKNMRHSDGNFGLSQSGQ